MIRHITKIKRWGGSNVILIPKEVLDEVELKIGDRVLLKAEKFVGTYTVRNLDQDAIRITKEDEIG